MSGLILDTSFTDVTLPQGESLASAILALSGLSHWWQADANHVVLDDGAIAQMTNRVADAGHLVQTTASKQAALTEAALGNYAEATFTAAAVTAYTLSSSLPDMTAPFSWIAVARPGAWTGAGRGLAGKQDGGGSAVLLQGVEDTLRFKFGTVFAQLAAQDEAWNVAIAAYNGTHIRLRVNGVQSAAVEVAGEPPIGDFQVGTLDGNLQQPWDGGLSDLLVANYDILQDTAAMSAIAEFVGQAYDLVA